MILINGRHAPAVAYAAKREVLRMLRRLSVEHPPKIRASSLSSIPCPTSLVGWQNVASGQVEAGDIIQYGCDVPLEWAHGLVGFMVGGAYDGGINAIWRLPE